MLKVPTILNGAHFYNTRLDLDNSYILIPVTGEMLYQDPKTKIEYGWDAEKNLWKQQGEDSNVAPEYDFDGQTYLHTG